MNYKKLDLIKFYPQFKSVIGYETVLKNGFWFNIFISLYLTLIGNKALLFFVYKLNFSSFLNSLFFKTTFVALLFALILLLSSVIYIFRLPKLIYLILIFFAVSADYFMLSYGILIDETVFQSLFETSSTEVLQYYHYTYFLHIFLLFIPISYLVYRSEFIKKSFFYRLKVFVQLLSVCLALIFFVSLFLYKDYASFLRNNRNVRHMINPVNTLYQAFRFGQSLSPTKKIEFSKLQKASFLKSKSQKQKPKVFVFVLGETARAMNYSLNAYKRETDAFLLNDKNLFNFSEAVSCGTATATSVPCLFSNFSREDFDKQKALNKENLIDVISQLGYESYWADNNTGCKGVCDRIHNIDLKDFQDENLCNAGGCYDEILLKALDKALEGGEKKNKAIYLHLLGSHGPTYFLRYPEKFKKFHPTCDTSKLSDCKYEEIVNAYDNTIYYSNYVISLVIKRLREIKDYDTALIYVSDHGESLGEKGIYLHSLPYYLAPIEQKRIPLFSWLSDSYIRNHPKLIKGLKEKSNCKLSHENIFHSVFGLLEITSKDKSNSLDLFSSEFICK